MNQGIDMQNVNNIDVYLVPLVAKKQKSYIYIYIYIYICNQPKNLMTICPILGLISFCQV